MMTGEKSSYCVIVINHGIRNQLKRVIKITEIIFITAPVLII
jgi:hypothetical protein